MTLFICIWLMVLTAVILLCWHNTIVDFKDIKEYVHATWGILPSSSYYNDIRSSLRDRLDALETNLTTEIACLATKNNEDIKRMGGKFEKWDLIKLDEKDLLITDIEVDDDGNVKVHCINNKGMPYTYYRDAPAFKNYARFIKHSVSPFDEQEVKK